MKQSLKYRYTILKAGALMLLGACFFAFGTPVESSAKTAPSTNLLYALQHPDSLKNNTVQADTTTAITADSSAVANAIPTDTTLANTSNRLMTADSLSASDSLATADSLDLFPTQQLTEKELKRKIRDSIWAHKDSIIRATPRLLSTYMFNDSIKNQRMFLWKTDGYFNKPTVLKPDTTYNDHFNELPYKKNDVNATYLGVSGSPMQYFNYFLREESELFPFFTPYMPYTYTMETMPFYNVKSPYTELAYWGTLFSNKEKEETNVKFLHTQNFTPSFNFNILYQRNGGNGMLENEKTDHRTFAITGNYIGKRYVAQGGYIFSRVKKNENGGISDLSMILDTIVDARTVPVTLKEASTAVKRNTIFITHSYGIPFNFKKDTSNTEYGEGTMAYIGHTGEYSVYTKSYKDKIDLQDSVGRALYNDSFYINPTETADSARVMNLENRFFLRLQPWAKEAIISKIDAGIGFQYLNIYNFNPIYFLTGNSNRSEHNMYLYFGASGELKKYFAWEGFGKYYLSGYNQNDFNIGGKVRFSAYPLTNGIHLTGKIDVSQKRPNFYFNDYSSNHYIWNNDFEKTTETRIEAKLEIPDYKMELFFGYSLLKNNIYLDSLANVQQNSEAMSVLTAYLKKDFRAWKFHFDHKILFQLSSNEAVVPLPKLALNLRYYLQAPLVKNVLTAQLGVEATFNTKYNSPGYSPALGMFFNQQSEETGETPYLDVFVNLQWKRASIFVKFVNIAQDWPTSDYFSANRYIKPQKALKIGIHWPFYVK